MFTSDRQGGVGLYSMNPDGSDVRLIPLGPGIPFVSTVSPDGQRVAVSINSDIYVVNVDGTDYTNLTHDASASDDEPAWSPDGSRIAFSAYQNGIRDIYVMSSDGTGVIQITSDTAQEFTPTWAPDGTQLAFGVGGRIMLYILAGGILDTLAVPDSVMNTGGPQWSSENRIMFQGYLDSPPTAYLFSIAPDGANLTRIAPMAVQGGRTAWSPDGSQIVLACPSDDICVMNADGTGLRNISAATSMDRFPTWSPVP